MKVSIRSSYVTLSLLLICIVALNLGCDNSDAQSTLEDFTDNHSGSVITAPDNTDSNGDDQPALYVILHGISTLGDTINTESLDEFTIADVNTECPEGNTQFDFLRGNFIKTFDNGDLLYGEWESGTACSDEETGIGTGSLEGVIVGGTGRFEGAEGTVTVEYTFIALRTTAEDGHFFAPTYGSTSFEFTN